MTRDEFGRRSPLGTSGIVRMGLLAGRAGGGAGSHTGTSSAEPTIPTPTGGSTASESLGRTDACTPHRTLGTNGAVVVE